MRLGIHERAHRVVLICENGSIAGVSSNISGLSIRRVVCALFEAPIGIVSDFSFLLAIGVELAIGIRHAVSESRHAHLVPYFVIYQLFFDNEPF